MTEIKNTPILVDIEKTINNPCFTDLAGQKFGNLLVVKLVRVEQHRHKNAQFWLCLCDCGNQVTRTKGTLTGGQSFHCGCLKLQGKRYLESTYHRRPECYVIHRNIIARCENPKAVNFHRYGGRGIKVCQGIKESREHFLVVAGKRPSPKYEIDRKDNNGHYSCGQCTDCIREGWKLNLHWVTSKQNGRNKENNHLITYNNKTRTISEWAEQLGILGTYKYARFRNRIYAGWSIDRVFNEPNLRPRKAMEMVDTQHP